MATPSSSEPFPRALTARESEILDFMLGVDDPRVEPLRQQRKSVVATGLCGCGCASIHLAVDRERHEPAAICRQPISADFNSARADLGDKREVGGLLVFLDEGWLSLLEVWWMEAPPAEFPEATAFHPPEVTCERDAAALAELEARSAHRAWPGTLGGVSGAVRRLLGRRPTSDASADRTSQDGNNTV
jgi:hypothetical protein